MRVKEVIFNEEKWNKFLKEYSGNLPDLFYEIADACEIKLFDGDHVPHNKEECQKMLFLMSLLPNMKNYVQEQELHLEERIAKFIYCDHNSNIHDILTRHFVHDALVKIKLSHLDAYDYGIACGLQINGKYKDHIFDEELIEQAYSLFVLSDSKQTLQEKTEYFKSKNLEDIDYYDIVRMLSRYLKKEDIQKIVDYFKLPQEMSDSIFSDKWLFI